jgi:hypothetical protein
MSYTRSMKRILTLLATLAIIIPTSSVFADAAHRAQWQAQQEAWEEFQREQQLIDQMDAMNQRLRDIEELNERLLQDSQP